MTRTMVAVDGAADVLAAVTAATSPRQAARRLRDLAPRLDLREARQATTAEGRSVVLAGGPAGPALALRWFAAGAPTTIHDHGSWGAAVVLEGRDRYERFEPKGGGAVPHVTIWLEARDVVWWLEPPHDIHRQCGSDDGALELVVVGTVAPDRAARTFVEGDALGPQRPLVDAVRRAYENRAFEPFAAHYADDVVADVCVPSWRFQVRGRAALADLFATGELGLPGQRLESFRALPTTDGCVVEVAVRFDHGDGTRRWRSVHVLRCRDDRVTEHLAYCTGHWDAATVARHDAEAPLVWP